MITIQGDGIQREEEKNCWECSRYICNRECNRYNLDIGKTILYLEVKVTVLSLNLCKPELPPFHPLK